MRKKTLIIAGSAAAVALVLGGTGIAFAATDGFERSDALTGTDLDRASEVAIAEIGGGVVTSAERDGDSVSTYELDLVGDDRAEYEVRLSSDFTVLSVERDGDERRGDDGAAGTATGDAGAADSSPGATTPGTDPDDLVGEELQKASDAAIAAAGGEGTVTDAERSDDADHAFDVEVRLADGTEIDVDLDAAFGVLKVDTDR